MISIQFCESDLELFLNLVDQHVPSSVITKIYFFYTYLPGKEFQTYQLNFLKKKFLFWFLTYNFIGLLWYFIL